MQEEKISKGMEYGIMNKRWLLIQDVIDRLTDVKFGQQYEAALKELNIAFPKEPSVVKTWNLTNVPAGVKTTWPTDEPQTEESGKQEDAPVRKSPYCTPMPYTDAAYLNRLKAAYSKAQEGWKLNPFIATEETSEEAIRKATPRKIKR